MDPEVPLLPPKEEEDPIQKAEEELFAFLKRTRDIHAERELLARTLAKYTDTHRDVWFEHERLKDVVVQERWKALQRVEEKKEVAKYVHDFRVYLGGFLFAVLVFTAMSISDKKIPFGYEWLVVLKDVSL